MEGMRLLAAYRAMEPPRLVLSLIRELGGGSANAEAQTFFLQTCLRDELCAKYSSEGNYVRRVLKELILAAEKDGHEVEDGLYDQHAIHLRHALDVPELDTRCYRTFTYALPLGMETSSPTSLLPLHVTLRVSLNMLEADTGCWPWPAGFYLAEFLLSFPRLFTHKCVLELGSGTGMTGICLSRLTPAKVILSDGDLAALANLKHNLAINGVEYADDTHSSHKVCCQHMSWETVTERKLQSLSADIILAADVVYNPQCIPHLVQVLRALLEIPNAAASTSDDVTHDGQNHPRSFPTAYLASVVRNQTTMDMFLDAAKMADLHIEDVTDSMRPQGCFMELSTFDRSQVCLHKITFR